ncbi:uncharacterized protein LOC114361775 [Ostrinia furnacalis]|uniref:uncharacterized protein LOC114361775 n=1 Tax=Ostrinia furnacalis TaxID=93504 RepID=UPI001039CF61|nr:uncharacterized protein LOC114361775 [Ostrinia furnacalis]
MNIKQENIVVDSCQFTPVYLVENTGAIQGRSYILTQANVEEPKPVTDNLKSYYENSGILETSFVNNAPTFSKPRILKRQESKLVGNNLKLASFLLPKTNTENNVNKQSVPISNIVYKPVVTTSVVHTVPKVEVERKIVRLESFPPKPKPTHRERILPKIKPKDDPPNKNPIKHTSVQLLKLGETYHSLNQLSSDQMKMVNQALKIFSKPENGSLEPTYDPVTNTRFIYKVVSPRELTVVGKNKIKREEIKKEERKEEIIKEIKREPKKVAKVEEVEPEPATTVPEEVKVTRSGRIVKFPKQIVEEIPQKPKKKNGAVVSCFQCSTEFCSLYRLQKHYENHPTHIPAKIHSNLFHCLLAIVKSGSEEDRTTIFIQQLEQLIEKLKSLLPCLLKKVDGVDGKPCTINDDLGRLFGMNPGTYNLNIDGLSCVKGKEGNCRHNPPPPKNNFNIDLNKPTPLWQTIQNDDANNSGSESEDCARINAVDKWPIANKRFRNVKQQKTQDLKSKRMKLTSESAETVIELDDFVISNDNFTVPIEVSSVENIPEPLIDEFIVKKSDNNCIQEPPVVVKDTQKITTFTDLPKKAKGAHTQFHSAHFDIRSSPIKTSSAATFRKFQINPEKLAKYEVQIIRPLELDKTCEEVSPNTEASFMQSNETEVIQNTDVIPEQSAIPSTEDNSDLQSIFRDELIELTCKDPHDIPNDLAFAAAKEWICSGLSSVGGKSDDDFIKTNSLDESFISANSLIGPALLDCKDDSQNKLQLSSELVGAGTLSENDNHIMNQGSASVLNFLDSLGSECLSYPETEIRNSNVDFQLDLFSFSNT